MNKKILLLGDSNLTPLTGLIHDNHIRSHYDYHEKINETHSFSFYSFKNKDNELHFYIRPSFAYNINIKEDIAKKFNNSDISVILIWGYEDINNDARFNNLEKAVENYLKEILSKFNLSDINLIYPMLTHKNLEENYNNSYNQWCDLLYKKSVEKGIKPPFKFFDDKWDIILKNKLNFVDEDHANFKTYATIWQNFIEKSLNIDILKGL